MGCDLDGGVDRRILQGIVDHVHQHPLDQHKIQLDQRQILRDLDLDGAVSQAAAQAFQREPIRS